LGITQFEMSGGLNDSPKFIQALGQIVLQAMGAESFATARLMAAD
jgi:hypothetical protein